MNHSSPLLTKGSILIVDDVPANLLVLSNILQTEGYDVRTASSGARAVESVNLERPDLILLDILMPDMDGYEVCQTLKSQRDTQDIPIIFISALQDALNKVKAFSVGGADYLIKPVEVPEAIARIEHQLKISRLTHELTLLRDVVVNTNDAVIVLNRVSEDESVLKIVYVNEAFTKMMQYSAAEIIGLSPHVFKGSHTSRETILEIKSALSSNQSLRVEILMYRKDHQAIWTEISLAPSCDQSGTITHWIAFLRNIDQRKQVEAELLNTLTKERELNELRAQFVSMVSHEYRTPLTIILSSIELLEQYSDRISIQERQEYYQTIRNAISRMTNLLSDLLALNESEAGALTFQPAPLNLEHFFHTLVSEFKPSLTSLHNLQLSIQGDNASMATPPIGNMDAKILHHLCTNLLQNAVKYSPKGGLIQFNVTIQPHHVILTVQDQGIGIPADEIPNLFNLFYRAKNVGHIAGTGLGLAIVKRLVEMHKGQIKVQSESDVGSCFWVTLPLNAYNPQEIANNL